MAASVNGEIFHLQTVACREWRHILLRCNLNLQQDVLQVVTMLELWELMSDESWSYTFTRTTV